MIDVRRLVERTWDEPSRRFGVMAALLRPLSAGYGAATALRNALYDRGVLPVVQPAIPAISVGNLSVGGTGKTPVSAWLAQRLVLLGARPAIVLRGYGDDEPLVHQLLNPAVPIATGADRVAAIARAAALGADVAVLDDAFQHRRVARIVDVVLVSADRWSAAPRLLPAGPWREPIASLARASLVLITRKAASASRAAEVRSAVATRFPELPVAVCALSLDELRGGDGERRPLSSVHGERVCAIAAIGDPAAFAAQLGDLGATVRRRDFPDHHAFSRDEAHALATDVAQRGELAVCTLKDAVKLEPHWPRAVAPLWYVSQRVDLEWGEERLSTLLDSLLRARRSHPGTAGESRPQSHPNGH